MVLVVGRVNNVSPSDRETTLLQLSPDNRHVALALTLSIVSEVYTLAFTSCVVKLRTCSHVIGDLAAYHITVNFTEELEMFH